MSIIMHGLTQRILVMALGTLILAGCGVTDPSRSASGDAPGATAQPSESAASSSGASGAPSAAPSTPVALSEGSEVAFRGARLIDASYPSDAGGIVSAWLVLPQGDGPFAAIVYLHGSETDRDDLVDEAAAMTAGGAASLVIDAPFARPAESRTGFIPNWFEPESEAALTQQTLDDVVRGIDLLLERPDVDPGRVGFVGHSWGASLGAHLAAADDRLIASVLVTGRPSWTGFLRDDAAHFETVRDSLGADGWERYLETMEPWDAIGAVADLDPASVYLQFGTEDDVVDAGDIETWRSAVPEGVRIDTYAAGHALDANATADRITWLVERLDLETVPPERIAEVGLPDATTLLP